MVLLASALTTRPEVHFGFDVMEEFGHDYVEPRPRARSRGCASPVSRTEGVIICPAPCTSGVHCDSNGLLKKASWAALPMPYRAGAHRHQQPARHGFARRGHDEWISYPERQGRMAGAAESWGRCQHQRREDMCWTFTPDGKTFTSGWGAQGSYNMELRGLATDMCRS